MYIRNYLTEFEYITDLGTRTPRSKSRLGKMTKMLSLVVASVPSIYPIIFAVCYVSACMPVLLDDIFLSQCHGLKTYTIIDDLALYHSMGRLIVALSYSIVIVKLCSNTCFVINQFVLQSFAIRSYLETGIRMVTMYTKPSSTYRYLRHLQLLLKFFLLTYAKLSVQPLQITQTCAEIVYTLCLFRLYRSPMNWTTFLFLVLVTWTTIVIHVISSVIFGYLG